MEHLKAWSIEKRDQRSCAPRNLDGKFFLQVKKFVHMKEMMTKLIGWLCRKKKIRSFQLKKNPVTTPYNRSSPPEYYVIGSINVDISIGVSRRRPQRKGRPSHTGAPAIWCDEPLVHFMEPNQAAGPLNLKVIVSVGLQQRPSICLAVPFSSLARPPP